MIIAILLSSFASAEGISTYSPWYEDGTNVLLNQSGDSVGIGVTPDNTLQVAGLIDFKDATASTYLGSSQNSSSLATWNTCIGKQACQLNNAQSNTAIGYDALPVNVNGTGDLCIGTFACLVVVSDHNTCVGDGACAQITTGVGNTMLGGEAGAGVRTSSSYNDLVGAIFPNMVTSNRNTAFGYAAMDSVTSSFDNLVMGYHAYANAIGGKYNTILGDEAANGLIVASASSDTIVGQGTAAGLTNGSNDTIIDDPMTEAWEGGGTISYALAIGGLLYGDKTPGGQGNMAINGSTWSMVGLGVYSGVIASSSPIPSCSCDVGGAAIIAGSNNQTGQCRTPTNASTCTITFSSPLHSAPNYCSCQVFGTALAVPPVVYPTAPTTTSFGCDAVTALALNKVTFEYFCMGPP